MAVENTMEHGYKTKLNFKVGALRFADEKFKFFNNGESGTLGARALDSASNATSCDTNYRVNKRYLTTLRARPEEGALDEETVYSTVKDALSQVQAASKTPRNH